MKIAIAGSAALLSLTSTAPLSNAFAPVNSRHLMKHKPTHDRTSKQRDVMARSPRSPIAAYQGSTGLIDITAPDNTRDVYAMEQWATEYGMQKADGVELYSQDGADWQLIANAPIAGGSSVLYVPSTIVMASNAVQQELGGSLEAAENALVQMEQGLQQRLPLFRLMVKILAEWDAGMESPYFYWLNSLPRQFYNGVAMTDACFECLPPYAAIQAMNERNAYSRFVNAIRKGFVPLNQNTINDDRIVKWAYNVALTRFHEVWDPVRQKFIAPMADLVSTIREASKQLLFIVNYRIASHQSKLTIQQSHLQKNALNHS